MDKKTMVEIAILEEVFDLITAKADEVESRPASQRVNAYCALIELRDEIEELIQQKREG
jgi:hypothetical protein